MAIDIIARGMIEDSNGNISQLSEKVSNHTDNSDIHVTVSDKENWNSHPNDVMASGNPVQLDGLQGGVPFSEMVVSGKNLICISGGTDTRCTSNISDDTLTLTPSDMSATSSSYYFIAIPPMKKGKAVTISADFENSGGNKIQIAIWRGIGGKFVKGSPLTTNINGNLKFSYFPDADYDDLLLLLYARTINSISNGNVIYSNLQMEYGTEATEYEPPITGRNLTLNVNGAEYTITPDSNPYTVPNDIRQQDGLNNISVSEGEISVSGVRKNAAIKRIWEKLDELTTEIIV